jgi:DNA-binding XRE family transcriptional regulator
MDKRDVIINKLKGYALGLPHYCVSEKELIKDAISLLTENEPWMRWKDERIASGRSLRQVAKAVGTSMGNLSRIENGKQIPSEGLNARLTAKFDEWKQDAGDRA